MRSFAEGTKSADWYSRKHFQKDWRLGLICGTDCIDELRKLKDSVIWRLENHPEFADLESADYPKRKAAAEKILNYLPEITTDHDFFTGIKDPVTKQPVEHEFVQAFVRKPAGCSPALIYKISSAVRIELNQNSILTHNYCEHHMQPAWQRGKDFNVMRGAMKKAAEESSLSKKLSFIAGNWHTNRTI